MLFLTIGVASAICPAATIVHFLAAIAVALGNLLILRIGACGQSETAGQAGAAWSSSGRPAHQSYARNPPALPEAALATPVRSTMITSTPRRARK